MKKLIRNSLALAALLLSTPAYAVCTGQFPGGTICNNPTTSIGNPSPTATPTLGIPGSVVGTLSFGNLTSGTIKFQPATGALGTSILTLPATSGTLATTAGANIPSIAQGDLLYGSATNVLSTLAKNTSSGRFLSNSGTSNNPAWFDLFGTANTWTASQSLVVPQNAITRNIITNTSTGVSATSQETFNNSANFSSVGIAGTGYTDVPILQNRSFLFASSGASGIAINNSGANPIVLGISNTEVARFGTNPVLQLTPTALSNNQGIYISQSAPTSGTVTGPIILNLFDATNGAGSTTAGFDSFGNFNSNTYGTRHQLSVGGANVKGPQIALSGNIRASSNTTGSDKIGTFGSAYINSIESAGGYFGIVGAAAAGSSATVPLIAGGEVSAAAISPAVITRRFGFSIVQGGSIQATTIDTALNVSGTAALGGAGAPFLIFTNFSDNYGLTPIATTGTLFYYDHSATIQHVFDFFTHPVTITGNILATPNMTIAGSSLTTLYALGIGTTSTDRMVLNNTTAAAAGAQQWSPRLRLSGTGWKTNATAASQTVDWIIENQPGQDAVNPTTALVFSAQINSLGYTPIFNFLYNRNAASVAYFNSVAGQTMALSLGLPGVPKWYLQNENGSSDNFVIRNSDANGNVARATMTQTGGIAFAGYAMIGSVTALTLATGELGFSKITASGSAPGAAGGKMELVCGTGAGTAKLIVYAGTSTTPATIVDNIGGGVTGC